MADETIGNGIPIDGDDFFDFDRENETAKISDLSRKIHVLEQEKHELVTENEENATKIKKLEVEIGEARTEAANMKERIKELEEEIERSQSDKKAVEAISARAFELETQVANLQHDLITAMTDGDEANAEVRELKKALAEKEANLERVEKEKVLTKEGFDREIDEAMKAKAISESKLSDLEKRLEGVHDRELATKGEKEKVEEEIQKTLDEKERQISGLKKRIEELEAAVAKNVSKLEKQKNENKELEALKNGVQLSLESSEQKVKEIETKMLQLQKEAEKGLMGLKEKTVESINGIAINSGLEDDVKGAKGLNMQWPVIAATGTFVIAGAVCYLYHARRR